MQPEAIKKYPPVLVVWEDICSTEDTGWRSIEDAIEWADDAVTLVHQVGFRIEEDTEYILIADSIFVDGSQVAPVTKIPKGVIREVRYLALEQTQRDPK